MLDEPVEADEGYVSLIVKQDVMKLKNAKKGREDGRGNILINSLAQLHTSLLMEI